ncbi:MAG: pentapeptide repeat-containing protein [Propionibacteriaceae bacterium]
MTIRTGADLDGEHLVGEDWSGVRASDARMLECEVTDCRMDETKLTGLRAIDTTWVRVSASGLAMPHASWHDSAIKDSRFGLLDLSASTLLRLTITDTKIDFLNLRGTAIREVVLTRVRLGEVTLGDATGTTLMFDDCLIGTVELHNTRLEKIDLSTSSLQRIDDLASLRGVVLSLDQVLNLAPAMATVLGATIAE